MTTAYDSLGSQHVRILFGLLMFLLMLLIPVQQRTAFAATLVVTNGTGTIADGDGCSLPEAIINANSGSQAGSTDCIAGISGANEIVLQTNVTLTAVHNSTNGDNGLPPIQSPLTIFGNNYTVGRSTLGGTPPFRIFYVEQGGFPVLSSLTLYDVTVFNGDASSGGAGDFGGGLYNNGRPVEINRSLFIGNHVTASGGAIFNANSGTTDIIQTTIGTVANPNTAVVSGGGIASFSGTLRVLDGSLLEFNNAPNGSGIVSLGGTIEVVSSTIQHHQGTNGAGIYTQGASTTNITNSTIQQNQTTGDGGGIYIQTGTVNLNNSLVTNNRSEGFNGGGGIYCNGTLNIQGSTISNNYATGIFAADGGGIYGNNCGLTIDNSTIASNRVDVGGNGAGINMITAPTISNSLFSDNAPIGASYGNSQGGALRIMPPGASTTNITNTRFENNRAARGGAIYINSGGVPTLNVINSSFVGNQTISTGLFDGGGAIYADGIVLNVISSLFANNSATTTGGADGGAINDNGNIAGQQMHIYNSTFSGNSASRGGAIWVNQDPNATLTNSTLANNTSTHATFRGAVGGGSGMTATNSILANGADGGNCMPNPVPPPISLMVDGGNNISDDATCGFTQATSANNLNPQIDARSDNGGPTQTHALLNTSPALDAANDTDCQAAQVNGVDQRGVGRGLNGTGAVDAPQAGDCDIGAFEFGAVLPTITFDTAASAVDELAGPVPLTIGYTLSSPAGGNLTGQTINLALQISGTAANGTDFTLTTALPGTLVIPAANGTVPGSIDVSVIDDTLVEGVENLVLTLVLVSGPALPGANMSHTVTITSDDVPVVSPIGPGAVAGGGAFFGGGGGTTIIVQQGGFTDADFMTKTVDRTLAAIGDTVTFTINASNPKGIPLTQVVIKDVLDSGYENPQVQSATMGSASIDDNTVTVSDFTLQPGESMELVITAQVSGRVLVGATLGNIASLESPDASLHFSNGVEVLIRPNNSSLFLETADDSVPIISPGNVRVIGSTLPRTGERHRSLWPFVVIPLAGVALVGGGVFARRRLAA